MSRYRPLIALLLAMLPIAALHAQGDGKPVVSVRILPATAVEPGTPVTIEGLAPLDGKGVVAIRIAKPDRSVAAIDVNPAANGDYSANFTATEAAGTYTVDVTSPAGLLRGKATFEVAVQEPEDDFEDAEQEALAVADLLDETLGDLEQQIGKLPDSPARDELKVRLDSARPRFRAAVKELRDFKGLVMMPLVDPVTMATWPLSFRSMASISLSLQGRRLRSGEHPARLVRQLRLEAVAVQIEGLEVGRLFDALIDGEARHAPARLLGVQTQDAQLAVLLILEGDVDHRNAQGGAIHGP